MQDLTTLVCLFHRDDRAKAAEHDLANAGISASSIRVIGGTQRTVDELEESELASFGMPDRDYDHLKAGLRDGGIVLAVSATGQQVEKVESIFAKHSAEKIDEAETAIAEEPLESPAAKEDISAVPIVQEDLLVGKRTVDQGGVRLYRKIVEVPVEQPINLREQHVRVDRQAVDRPVGEGDLAFQPRTVELTETVEEAVIGKEARVVEEVIVSKDAIDRTETIHDTVRHTEVEIEELPSSNRNHA